MKYLLINTFDEIISKVEFKTDVGKIGAETYFRGVKRMPNTKEFDKLWKVMSQSEYELNFKNNLQDRQMGKLKYEWWREESAIADDELKLP